MLVKIDWASCQQGVRDALRRLKRRFTLAPKANLRYKFRCLNFFKGRKIGEISTKKKHFLDSRSGHEGRGQRYFICVSHCERAVTRRGMISLDDLQPPTQLEVRIHMEICAIVDLKWYSSGGSLYN